MYFLIYEIKLQILKHVYLRHMLYTLDCYENQAIKPWDERFLWL